MDNKQVIEEMISFMLEKSNSANVEPVFTTNEGNEIVLGEDLTKLLNDILEQAFIPFLAEALCCAGYRKQNEVISAFITEVENAWLDIEEFYDEELHENLVRSNQVYSLLDKTETMFK